MKVFSRYLVAMLLLAAASSLHAASVLNDFITAKGDQLMEGDKPFRFISFDIPNLQMIEDNVPFAESNPWRLPDKFELTDALATVHQMGGTVVRTYVISVIRTNDPAGAPRHVLGPGKFGEEAFRELDLALKIANEQGVRLVIPLVDNWKWQGGRAEYGRFRGKTRDDFWTDPQVIADFEQTIHFILTRTNTYTGQVYSDDKAILCWETGNELTGPPVSWTREIARYIKSLDHNHLVMDGTNGRQLTPEQVAIPEIDIVTTHHYPSKDGKTFAQLIRSNWEIAKGKKPYVEGEFGFVNYQQLTDTMQAVMDTGMSGGLLWSLRFRDRDGGFYWHTEPGLGGYRYKAFHWPGSPIGDSYDERKLLSVVRSNAFAIRGLAVPPIPVPAPPTLLPIADAGAISWQGSVGADLYIVERAPRADGPWAAVGDNIDESYVQYHPLFSDENAPGGDWYYRVRAKNDSGISDPSNVDGPVHVTYDTFVDELSDLKKVAAVQGNIAVKTDESRATKEDAHRAAGNAGDALIYQFPTVIKGFRIFTFFPHDLVDLKISTSADGLNYQVIAPQRDDYYHGVGDYNYWKPVLYHADNMAGSPKYLKLEMAGEIQIGRVEIMHDVP
jgi:hypothetical protein